VAVCNVEVTEKKENEVEPFFIKKKLDNNTKRGFEEMNKMLKELAERK